MVSWNLSKEHSPANTSISDFLVPQLGDSKFLSLKSSRFLVLCYGNHMKLPRNTHNSPEMSQVWSYSFVHGRCCPPKHAESGRDVESCDTGWRELESFQGICGWNPTWVLFLGHPTAPIRHRVSTEVCLERSPLAQPQGHPTSSKSLLPHHLS